MHAKIEEVIRPGATLHVETRGNGPLLVLVVGGNGDCAVFEGLAAALADRFTVLTSNRTAVASSAARSTGRSATSSPPTSTTPPR